MRLSDERINYLSKHIVTTLEREKMIDIMSETMTTQEVRLVIVKFLKNEEAIDQKIRTKIATIKRNIPEHSKEWEILYEQYYNEEMSKLRI